MTRVSVVIPTYNCAARLVRALQSIAAQSYPREHIEIVVIDDGSSDDTAECVAEFAANARVDTRYVRQQNAGPAAARNHGLRLARGEAIAFLDADDWWEADKLARQMPLLAGEVGLVYCGNRFVDAQGEPIANYVREIPVHRGDILLPLFCEFFLLTSAVVLSKGVLGAIGSFREDLPVGEDYEFFLRIAARFRADCAPEKLLVRCVRPDSLSRRDYALDARIDLATFTQFLREHPQFERAHRAAVRQRIAKYRYDFAYRLLADGRARAAIGELRQSLRTRPSVAAFRTLVRATLAAGRPAAATQSENV
jgi:glycosyltransferase involved in cell wall biosynthesis